MKVSCYADVPDETTEKEELGESVDEALRAGQACTLVYFNVENFRAINRQYGSHAADGILRAVGKRMAAAFGASNVARLPGDEFALAFASKAGEADSTRAQSEVARLLSIPFAWHDVDVSLSAAFGAACSPRHGTSFQQLFDDAEAAMLAARRAAHEHKTMAHPRQAALPAALTADTFRGALDRGEFVLYYQPQVDLHTNTVSGAEALIRWAHPERGLLPPAEFVNTAEQTNAIVDIGRWALQEACRQAARWRESGHDSLVMAVNLSARQFEAGGLEDTVRGALDDACLPASCLELELTESILIEDAEIVLDQIRQLKRLGLTLSLDDFGTGYSSLSYLNKFAVDKIKIDRSFVVGLGKSANDASIVRAIVQIARSLGMRTIAEGVEDRSMLGFLQLLGCDEVQGYHFSPPLSATAFSKMLTVLAR